MSKTRKLFVAIVGMGLLATCHQSILTPGPGSEIVALLANPTFIPANGGVSVITAVVQDATGQPVADGTVVQFFTDLGRVDPQGKTNDGVAKVNLRSDGHSGEATVVAVIGGGTGPAPAPSPSATAAASSTSTSTSSRQTASLSSTAVADPVGVKVKIGTNLPKRILLSANPRNIAAGAPRFSTLTATVIDEDGNPISNIPVVFRIPPDRNVDTYEDSLESHGLPVYTDNNGQVRDRLFTGRDAAARPKTIVVSAEPVVDPQVGPATTDIGVNF